MPVSKSGRKYAKGSTTTYAGWEPRVCCICSQPIVKSDGRSHRFHMDDRTGEAKSWHTQCETGRGWPGTKKVA